jgi:hypothetical protein
MSSFFFMNMFSKQSTKYIAYVTFKNVKEYFVLKEKLASLFYIAFINNNVKNLFEILKKKKQ